jgi:glycogen synthase
MLPWKGIHLSVKMLSLLLSRGVEAELTITDTQRIADWNQELDTYRRHVVGLAKSLGVLERIRLRTPRFEDMPALYAASDVVIYPTVGEEPYGLVPLEAMSSARPVVASRSGGIVETILDGVTGFLVERDNVEQLADRVEQLARDPALMERMGQAGRQRVEELFDARNYVSAMIGRYRSGRRMLATTSR